MTYQFDYGSVLEYWPRFVEGMWSTIWISAVSMALAVTAGLAVYLMRVSEHGCLNRPAAAFVQIVRNTPFLVQIFFIFFGLPSIGLSITPIAGALLALTINGAAYISEIFRGGFQSLGSGLAEASKALGLTRSQIFIYVLFKPGLRAIYPALTSQFTLLLLTSSVVSSISAEELTSISQQIEMETYRSFEVFSLTALLYLVISYLFALVFTVFQRRFLNYPI
ncbi:amino acid ABC transporter permease [Mesorhizobium sp. SB112]|uniref:amino acid ABC transporter permease n=1 Tax=Mesorhizobium sp. SB112 TaxID=3151853 RepID=UPI003267BBEC